MHGQFSPEVIYRILKLMEQKVKKQTNKQPKHKASIKTEIFL